MGKQQILIVCGEASGDLNAGNLAKAIKNINPEIRILAVGGPVLTQAGAEVFHDIKGLACMGFFDVLKKLPKFLALKKLILKKIKTDKPDAVILVDFSGFNLRLAKAINKSIPVIYYVSPQVWASRQGRVKTIKKYILKMIVLFKFEEEFYRRFGIDASFAGHPLLDIVNPTMQRSEFLRKFDISESKRVIALLPGSRSQEIEHILPVMLKASKLIDERIGDVQFVIAKSPQVNFDIYNRIINRFKLNLKIVEGKTYDCLNAASFGLVGSGTATLETAIMQKPFAIIYKMGILNYLLYRPQVKLPYIGMVNIVAGKLIVPEFIQFGANPERISNCVFNILQNPSKAERIKLELGQIKSLLGEKGASLRAAKIILDFLNIN
ncbi:MAG: lipid-A-disaccharide synthase [Omnitrophica WOR_2 bacterium RBG_13_44_8b]|nr:MAG: lipid-A-disaccharide synthase [Omnitrophica WOR_2 bacterium RBG_13_44_8b]